MTLKEEGLYIRLCALAWDSEEPGTIVGPLNRICHELNIFVSTLRRFLESFPSSLLQEGENYFQPKLREQWHKYQEYQQKMSALAMRRHHPPHSSAPAFALATALTTTTTQDTLLGEGVRGRTKRATRWPEGFSFTEKLKQYAESHHVALTEWEHFENHHKAKGSRFVDWERAWYTWIQNSKRFGGTNGSGKSRKELQADRAASEAIRELDETTEQRRARRVH